jgi:hypothetical protein
MMTAPGLNTRAAACDMNSADLTLAAKCSSKDFSVTRSSGAALLIAALFTANLKPRIA